MDEAGLEQVAEELMGKDSMDKLLQPFKDLEQESTEDWEPQTTCNYCQSKSKLSDEAHDPSLWEAQETIQKDAEGVHYIPQVVPKPYCSLLTEHDTENQPLDLSANAALPCSRSPLPDTPSPKSATELKVPHVVKSGKKKEFCGKKSYTEVELHAAVSEIRSGKIGTRRASVLYGIPRSTLRNKIFKLEASVQNGMNTEPHKLTMLDLLQAGVNTSNHGNTAYNLQACYEEDTGSEEDDAWSRKLEQMRRKHNLTSTPEKLGSRQNRLDEAVLSDSNGLQQSPYAHELKLPILPGIVRKLAQQRMQMERERSMESELSTVTPRSVHNGPATTSPHHVELKIPSYKPMRAVSNGLSHIVVAAADMSSPDTPASAGGKIGDTLKHIIAKTIAEKVRSRAQVKGYQNGSISRNDEHITGSSVYKSETQEDQVFVDSIPPATLQTNVENTNGPPPFKRIKPHLAKSNSMKHHHTSSSVNHLQEKSENKPSLNGDPQKPLKKTRPKRGQYRRYNSQLLIEAVKAVQRGEMSVHRAGSYFGVPHSTLEYKVKERHLLRKKKIEEKKKQESVNDSVAAVSTSGNSSDSSLHGGSSAQPIIGAIASHLNLPPANGTYFSSPILGATANEASAMNSSSAYNPGFALNTSASELLKKLQQKVQAKASIGEAFHD